MLLIMVAVTPVFFNIQSSTSFEPDKAALLRGLAAAGMIALVWGRKHAGWSGVRRRQEDLDVPGTGYRVPGLLQQMREDLGISLWVLAGLVAATALSTAVSVDPITSLWGNYDRAYGLLAVAAGVAITLLMYAGCRAGAMWLIVDAALLGAGAPVLYALLQVLGYDPVIARSVSFVLGQRASATLGNPLFLADYLLLALMLAGARLAVGTAVARSTPLGLDRLRAADRGSAGGHW